MDEDQREELQHEFDEYEDEAVKVQHMTLLRKLQVAKRLNDFESESKIEEGKSLYREYREMFERDPEVEAQYYVPEAEQAFFVSLEYLKDLYEFKLISSKWS